MSSSEEEEGPSHVQNEDSEDNEVDDEDLGSEDDDLEDEEEIGLSDDEDEAGPSEPCTDDATSIEPQQEVPKDIEFSSAVVGISCHPKRNIVASGSIDGPVTLHSYDSKECGNKEIIKFEHHKKPCRAVKFSDKGDYLFTAASDASIYVLDLEANSVFRKFTRDNGSPLYSLLPIDDYLMAAGEEDGQVVLWDFRMQAPIQCFEDCEDYISSLVINKEKRTLLATCGDGTLAVYNVRGKKLDMRSEEFHCDLLSAGIFKDGTKVAVGAGDGSINIFNWGEFGNISDRFPGHPGQIDSMAVYSDDVICTGCDDGKIRVVQLFPTRFLGVLGSHHGFAIEGVSLSHDKALLASTSHDHKIKFWDLSGIGDLTTEDVKDTKKRHRQIHKEVNDFFSDL